VFFRVKSYIFLQDEVLEDFLVREVLAKAQLLTLLYLLLRKNQSLSRALIFNVEI